jgi:hypothetical protein
LHIPLVFLPLSRLVLPIGFESGRTENHKMKPGTSLQILGA